MNADIINMIKGMDKRTVDARIAEAKKFLATPEGKETMKKLSSGQMPDGSKIPDNLKEAAQALSKDPATARRVSSFLGG